jgi:hypothetical protein
MSAIPRESGHCCARDPVDFLQRRADALAQRSTDLKKTRRCVGAALQDYFDWIALTQFRHPFCHVCGAGLPARVRIASSIGGQDFSCSGVNFSAALTISTRISVNLAQSAALKDAPQMGSPRRQAEMQ